MNIIEDKKRLKQIRRARTAEYNRFVSNPSFVSVMNKSIALLMDDSSRGISLTISGCDSDRSCTDGKRITLGMLDYFFDEQYTPLDWMAVFKALLVHEVQHINSSNFSDIQLISQEYSEYMEAKGFPMKRAKRIAKSMLNILEDGRIETIALKKLPGYRIPFTVVNNEIWARLGPSDDSSEPSINAFLNAILAYSITAHLPPDFSRYPQAFQKEILDRLHYVDDAVYAVSSAQCREVCKTILWDTADLFISLLEKEPESQQEYDNPINKPSGAESDSDDDDDDEQNEYTSNDECEFGDPDPSDKEAREQQREEWSSSWGINFEQTPTEGISSEVLAAIRRGMQEELNSSGAQDATQLTSQAKDPFKEIISNYADDNLCEFKEIPCKIPDTPLPADIKRIADRLEDALRKILVNKNEEKRNLRKGRLDHRALYRAPAGTQNIFYSKGSPIKTDMAVSIFLDNSGSMSSGSTKQSNMPFSERLPKFAVARTAAGIIESALRNFADIKITLFNTNVRSVIHKTVKDFKQPTRGGFAYNSIQSIPANGGNKDGFSIRIATKELLMQRKSKRVLIILSDGTPSGYDCQGDGLIDVREAVKEARQKGVIVIPIMFGDAQFRAKEVDSFRFMYDTFISCDPAYIADEFQKLFIRLIHRA